MKEDYIDKLTAYLSAHHYTEKDRKQISYGVQLTFTDGAAAHTLRGYENAKGRITLDASQIKDEDARLYVASFNPDGNPYPLMEAPLIGTDEAGKGDYFGPLCVCALYADETQYLRLKALGVRDSKTLTDKKIRSLAAQVIETCPISALSGSATRNSTRCMKKQAISTRSWDGRMLRPSKTF
jgi:ribonuclease HIII